MTNNYPTNNQSSKSNPFTGYVYPYPTGGASRPPDNRTYEQRQYDAKKNRAVTGGSGPFNWKDPGSWASGYQRFMYDFGHPMEATFGNNDFATTFDKFSPVQALSRGAMALGRGDFREAAADTLRGASFFVPGGFLASSARGAVLEGGAELIDVKDSNVKDSNGIPFTKEPLLSQTRDMTMTAEEMQRRAAMERNRTDAAGNSGMGGRNTVYTDGVRPPGGYPGAAVPGAAVPAPLDLAPLDAGQLSSTGQSLVMLEQIYQDALNQYGLGEKQGRQAYVQDVQGARRQATGAAQDLSTQLAASGMANSPAAAFAAGQMTDAPRQARETAARKSLDQLLADITTGRTQARTQRDMEKLRINQMISDYRTKNTFENQRNAYGRLAGN
jgi:hypothetical protein